jgi:hypothetical protein
MIRIIFVAAAALVAVPAWAQQGNDRRPEGNLGAGAAMTGAQQESAGQPSTGGSAAPPQQATTSPRSPTADDAQARRGPEGNLGAGAAMTGAQRESSGLPASGGGAAVPAPTTSPRTQEGAGPPSR